MARAAGARAVGAAFTTLGRVRRKRRGTLPSQPAWRGRRIGPGRYMLIATTSAVAWALAWMSAGYALGHVTGRMPTAFGFLTTLGFLAGAILAVCLAVCLVVRHRRRGRGTGGHRAGRPAR